MSLAWRVPTPVRLNVQGIPSARIVPAAVRFMVLSLLIWPFKVADTVAPPAQVADIVPPIDVADCWVISHFTSVQLPIGRPAIDDEPQAPPKPDAGAGEGVEPDAVLPPEALLGAVGATSFEVFSKPHPAASVDAIRIARKEACFMVYVGIRCAKNSGRSGRAIPVSHKPGQVQ